MGCAAGRAEAEAIRIDARAKLAGRGVLCCLEEEEVCVETATKLREHKLPFSPNLRDFTAAGSGVRRRARRASLSVVSEAPRKEEKQS